jgi:hypothetical protein
MPEGPMPPTADLVADNGALRNYAPERAPRNVIALPKGG